MNLDNYVAFGTYQTQLLNIRDNQFRTYTISAPVNSKGRVSGFELAWQQTFANGFGGAVNYTYADAEEKRSCPSNPAPFTPCITDLVGASKNTYNIVGFYENHGFGARLAYTHRSAFFVGLDRSSPQYQDDTGVLSMSLSYAINKNFAITFDALNLNDPGLLRERAAVLFRPADEALDPLPGVRPLEGGASPGSALFSRHEQPRRDRRNRPRPRGPARGRRRAAHRADPRVGEAEGRVARRDQRHRALGGGG
jgi:hypothetical protein